MIPIRSMLDAQLAHHALRAKAGLSREQVAAKLQISYQTVRSRENGDSGFGVDALAQLAALFGLQLALVPNGERPGCCDHCLKATEIIDARRPHRTNLAFGAAWNRLYDAIAQAVGRGQA